MVTTLLYNNKNSFFEKKRRIFNDAKTMTLTILLHNHIIFILEHFYIFFYIGFYFAYCKKNKIVVQCTVTDKTYRYFCE